VSGLIVDGIGLKDTLPPSVYRRLNRPNEAVTVYRLP